MVKDMVMVLDMAIGRVVAMAVGFGWFQLLLEAPSFMKRPDNNPRSSFSNNPWWFHLNPFNRFKLFKTAALGQRFKTQMAPSLARALACNDRLLEGPSLSGFAQIQHGIGHLAGVAL